MKTRWAIALLIVLSFVMAGLFIEAHALINQRQEVTL